MCGIVIIGSNGYIGQHIAHKLIKLNFSDIYLFDIHNDSLVSSGIYKQLNLINPIDEETKGILSQADFIFLFSGLTGTIKSVEQYSRFIEINELGLLNILDCIKDNTIMPKIIFPSTRLVYKGVNGKLLTEDDEKEYKTIYAVNKFACEQYLNIYKNLYNINYTIFRICVPYGNLLNNELSFGTLSHFIKKARGGENIVLFGDGKLKRTFTHIEDICELIIQGGMNSQTNNQIFNIGSYNHMSLYEVAISIADLYHVKVEFTDFPANDLKIESGDTMFDGSKLCKLINYNYKHSFYEWINNL